MVKRLFLSLVFFGAGGCSKTIDGSSAETFETSVAAVMDSLEGDKRVVFHDAVKYLTEVHNSTRTQKILHKVDATEAIAISDCYKNIARFSDLVAVKKDIAGLERQIKKDESMIESLRAEKKVADESALIANKMKQTVDFVSCQTNAGYRSAFSSFDYASHASRFDTVFSGYRSCGFQIKFRNETKRHVERVRGDILLKPPGAPPVWGGTFVANIDLKPTRGVELAVWPRTGMSTGKRIENFTRLETEITRTRLYDKAGFLIADSGMFSGEKSSRLQELTDGVDQREASIKEGEAKIVQIKEDSSRYQLKYKKRISRLGTQCH